MSVDYLAGYEAGKKSARFNPPEHLGRLENIIRWTQYKNGFDAARTDIAGRRTLISARHPDGREIELEYKGWRYDQNAICTRLERMGVYGDVLVFRFHRDGSISSRENWGI